MKILHIENDQDFVYYIKENLEQFGFEITNFYDPEEAIAHFEENSQQYDIIICDSMPGSCRDGEDVVSILRLSNPIIPIIAQSDFPNHIDKMFNSGATWSVPRTFKPEDFNKFQKLLRDLALKYPKL